MPIVPAYRNIIAYDPSPYRVGRAELSLDPAPAGPGRGYRVEVVALRLRAGYHVGVSWSGRRLIYRDSEEHAAGMELEAALEAGLAEVVEPATPRPTPHTPAGTSG